MSTGCEHCSPGYCDRHQIWKPEHWTQLCQMRQDYFALWESGNGPGQLPPLFANGQLDVMPTHAVNWAVGIVATPHEGEHPPESVLEQCISSLGNSGFPELVIFSEPGIEFSEYAQQYTIVERPETFGVWKNWITGLGELLDMFPDAQAIAIARDDVLAFAELRMFLEHDLWPAPLAGVVLPFCSWTAEDETTGYISVDSEGLALSSSFIFPRDFAQTLVDHPLATPAPSRAIPGFISQVLSEEGREAYGYYPGLCEVARAADTSYAPGMRYNLPSGDPRPEIP